MLCTYGAFTQVTNEGHKTSSVSELTQFTCATKNWYIRYSTVYCDWCNGQKRLIDPVGQVTQAISINPQRTGYSTYHVRFE